MIGSVEREIDELRTLVGSERDPEGRAFAPLADALRRAGRHEEALEVLADGLERHPSFTSGHVVAGRVHRDLGETDDAVTAFRRVLDLDGDNVMALHGLGRMLVVRGESEEAGRLLSRAAELGYTTELEEEGPAAAPGARDEAKQGVERVEVAPDAPEEGASAGATDGVAVEEPAVEESAEEEPAAEPVSERPPEDPVRDEPTAAESEELVTAAGPEFLEDVDELADLEEAEGGRDELEGEDETGEVEAGGDPSDDVGADADEVEGPRTRTMAELYVRQGMTDRAVRVYEHLLRERPGDDEVRARLEELRGRVGGGEAEAPAFVEVPSEPAAAPARREMEDVETVAREMAESGHSDPVESPFSWTAPDQEPESASDRSVEPISAYFSALLAYEPGGDTAGDAATVDAGRLAPEPDSPGSAAVAIESLAPDPAEPHPVELPTDARRTTSDAAPLLDIGELAPDEPGGDR